MLNYYVTITYVKHKNVQYIPEIITMNCMSVLIYKQFDIHPNILFFEICKSKTIFLVFIFSFTYFDLKVFYKTKFNCYKN